MPNRYEDQDYPKYYERSDRYNSRSNQDRFDQNQQRNRSGSGRENSQGGSTDYDRDEQSGFYGSSNDQNYRSQGRGGQKSGSTDRGYDDFASSSRPSSGGFGQRKSSDQGDYTLYGYDRDTRYADRTGDQGGYGERTEDYDRNYGYSGGGGNYARSYDRDQQDREHGGSSRYYGNQSGGSSSYNQPNRQGFYGQGGNYTGSSESGFDYTNRARNEQDERNWINKTTDELASWFGDEEAARRRQRDARESNYNQFQNREQGGHRGRGPKSYRRSDERIKEDINDRLTDYAYLDASDIEVEVSNGEAILTGTVDSRYAKRMAEDIAENVSGVAHIENRLRIKQQGEHSFQNQAGFSSSSAAAKSTHSEGTYGSREDLATNYSQNSTGTSATGATTGESQTAEIASSTAGTSSNNLTTGKTNSGTMAAGAAGGASSTTNDSSTESGSTGALGSTGSAANKRQR